MTTQYCSIGQATELAQRWETILLAAGMAPKTIKNYMSWANRMTKRWDVLSEATFDEMVMLASASLRRQAYSATTIHGFQCAMSRFSKDIWGWNAEQSDKLIRARPNKTVHTVPSVDEVSKFLDILHGDAKIIGLLCYCCGVRISEAVQLQLADINLTTGIMNITTSKGAKGRKVPIPPEMTDMLRERVEKSLAVCEADLMTGNIAAPLKDREYARRPSRAIEPGQWPVFPQDALVYDGRAKMSVRVFVHASNIEKQFAAARLTSKVLTRITPHRLRDAFAVHSLLGGVLIVTIQERMGHASIETTAKYLAWLLTEEAAKDIPALNLFRQLSPQPETTAAAI